MSSKTSVLTVADLHRNGALLEALEKVIAGHRPAVVALVGDFLDAGEDHEGRVTTRVCAQLLARLPCAAIVFVRGNHEEVEWSEFAKHWETQGRAVPALHGEAFHHGPMTFVGFPCFMGDESAFPGDPPPLPTGSDEWLPEVMRSEGRASRTLWLMHEPPADTPLTESESPVEGNPERVQAIGRFSPWLTASGHDHGTPIKTHRWYDRIGQTTCVNVGQTENGPLHYCLIEAEFQDAARSLPIRMQVTAYPWKETIALPAGVLVKGTKHPADALPEKPTSATARRAAP